MIFHCISNNTGKNREKWISMQWLSTSRCSIVICFLSTDYSYYSFLISSFRPLLSQVVRVIKMTKIRTFTPKHLFYKEFLKIYLIFKIVFTAFTSLDGSVTIATSSHNIFFKATFCKWHIVPTCIVYSGSFIKNV